MATQILTRVLCDFCNADDVETPNARTETVTIGGDTFEVDVCDTHGKPLLELSETLSALGRKLPKSATERARVKPSRQPSDGDGNENKCPECGSTYNFRSSLTSHVRSVHGVTLAELEGKPLNFPCTRCERAFASPQAVSVHETRVHGPLV